MGTEDGDALRPQLEEHTLLSLPLSSTELVNASLHDYRNLVAKAMAYYATSQEEWYGYLPPFPKVDIEATSEETIFRYRTTKADPPSSEVKIPRTEEKTLFISELKKSLSWLRDQLIAFYHQTGDPAVRILYTLAIFLNDASLALLAPNDVPFSPHPMPEDFNPYQLAAQICQVNIESCPLEAIPYDFRLVAIFFNLINNATRKAREAGAASEEVTVSFQRQGESLIVSITNPARVTESQKQDLTSGKVFALGTTDQKGSAHGYGLAISQLLARQLGSEITIQVKEVEEATHANSLVTFTLIVPLDLLQDARLHSDA